MARYGPSGIIRVQFVPTIASQAAPTVAEVTAGQDLTIPLVSMTGWRLASSKIEVPDLGSRVTGSVSGRLTPGDASIQFYSGDATGDIEKTIEDLLTQDSRCYILRFPPVNGAKVAVAAAAKCSVFPVEIQSNWPDDPEASAGQTFTVEFAIRTPPTKVATLAA